MKEKHFFITKLLARTFHILPLSLIFLTNHIASLDTTSSQSYIHFTEDIIPLMTEQQQREFFGWTQYDFILIKKIELSVVMTHVDTRKNNLLPSFNLFLYNCFARYLLLQTLL